MKASLSGKSETSNQSFLGIIETNYGKSKKTKKSLKSLKKAQNKAISITFKNFSKIGN